MAKRSKTTDCEHTGKPLPAKVFHINYIADKMRCIFGPTLDAHPEAKEAFIRSMGAEGR